MESGARRTGSAKVVQAYRLSSCIRYGYAELRLHRQAAPVRGATMRGKPGMRQTMNNPS
jgi:hypothetical protein